MYETQLLSPSQYIYTYILIVALVPVEPTSDAQAEASVWIKAWRLCAISVFARRALELLEFS
jgi:hypothetical protein